MGRSHLLRWEGRQPLSRHPGFSIDDPEAALASAEKIMGPHSIDLPAGREGFCAQLNAMRWPRVMLSYHAYRAPVQVTPGELPVLYAVNLPIAGYAEVRQRDSEVRATPQTAAVFSGENVWTMDWSADHEVLSVIIDPPALEQHLSRMTGQQVSRLIEFAPAMELHGAGASWAGALQLLLDLADRASEPPPLLTAEVENAVMTTLLAGQPHSYSGALLDPPAPPSRVVQAAIDLMQSSEGARLTVTQIAGRVGVSERSLQLAFRRRLGVTPSSYLRDVRLDQVRRELLATPPDCRSVSRIAADWGFSNPGRFAASYRRKFGENPSHTGRG